VRARIRKTAAFTEGVKEKQYTDGKERKVKLSWAAGLSTVRTTCCR
jgi:hypothetical protein